MANDQNTKFRGGGVNINYSVANFGNFPATQILREINFGHFAAPKTAVLTIWTALNFEFLGTFDISKSEIFLTIKIQSL